MNLYARASGAIRSDRFARRQERRNRPAVFKHGAMVPKLNSYPAGATANALTRRWASAWNVSETKLQPRDFLRAITGAGDLFDVHM